MPTIAAEFSQRIDVAVAILQRENGDVLWSSRPEGKPYAGYWEFPGGKVEPNESVWQALVREIKEELGVTVRAGGPWMLVDHDYPHAKVRLHFMRVWRWQGKPMAREQQRFQWAPLLPMTLQSASDISPILPATEPLLRKLALPRTMLLTQVEHYGLESFLERLHRTLSIVKKSIENSNLEFIGVGHSAMPLIQFREKNLSDKAQRQAVAAVWNALQQYGASMVVNSACRAACEWSVPTVNTTLLSFAENRSAHLPLISQYLQQTGVHWTEQDLQSATHHSIDLQRINTASVHSASGLNHAFRLGMDAAVLGTVLPSLTHPECTALGWAGLLNLASQARLPVYGIGGLSFDDVQTAAEHGAHGVALMRAAWI